MKTKLLIILLSFYLPIISQNKEEDCKLYFKEIGIKDFNLGSNYKSFVDDSKKIKRKFKKEDVYGIDIVTFSENIILFKEKKTVKYNLKFHGDTLVDYTFKMKIGNFRKASAYYDKIVELLEKNKNKNEFIKRGNYYNMKRTKICKKFLELDSDFPNHENESLSGGVGYESPIWEKQFIDYLKATGQYKE
ncbi:hypothetical protein BC749_103294 [Flavobacterium araucananum]|uniref:Uncharacterized protein n=1 Tax=Flavobacterium araucananum TaxID=946678 RepID=A0A227NF41_9FLAO|nr:hypothetical protein [Flavobacterium araucananum]OXE96310.1 hypothetical protein B0A64_24005 [Flavobacterium araucananum]PWJ99913.1 hypothetical protein BC749_103294 [Flavobacterium araucananum]